MSDLEPVSDLGPAAGVRTRLPRLLFVLGYCVVLTAVGVVGYMILEGWSFADALYMTAITVTAVGYHEVAPLASGGWGQYWTMALVAGGLTGLGMWFALVTAFLVEMDIGTKYKRHRAMVELNRTKDHVIVCGGGQMGRQVIQELREAGMRCVVVERDGDVVAALRKKWPDLLVVRDDATRDSVLREARIAEAATLVSCLSSDTDNLFVCLSARDLHPGLVVVARAEHEAVTAKMQRAGADYVVSPSVTGAHWVASVLARPAVASFLDVATPGSSPRRRLEQVAVGEGSPAAGTTLAESRIPQETGLVVLAVQPDQASPADTVFNPVASTRLAVGDAVIVLADRAETQRLKAYLAADAHA